MRKYQLMKLQYQKNMKGALAKEKKIMINNNRKFLVWDQVRVKLYIVKKIINKISHLYLKISNSHIQASGNYNSRKI